MKARILACADWYLPGNKGGGSVSAISNLIDLLGDDHSFYLITRDHDHTDNRSYNDICTDRWSAVGKAQVWYVANPTFLNIYKRIWEIKPEILYLNSFFSGFTWRCLILRRLGLIPAVPVVLAPRGELSPAALEIKAGRKRRYRALASQLGLYQGLFWQASSTREEQEIRATLKQTAVSPATSITVAPDVPDSRLIQRQSELLRPQKRTGIVRMIALSRISPQKNLLFSLKMMSSIRGQVLWDIYGPVDDPSYWLTCQQAIQKLPRNIEVNFKGTIPSCQVTDIFSQYHFQVLPTRGENFGYVILEALASGCPVVISDQTPWRNLAPSGVGWDLPLSDPGQWIEVLQQCVEMGQDKFDSMSRQARNYFRDWACKALFRENTMRLFQCALEARLELAAPSVVEKSADAAG
jgi:glycosyltransferase involved in cell wall biosynthesis